MKKTVIVSALSLAIGLPMMASAYTIPTINFAEIGVTDPSSFDSRYDWKMSLSKDDFQKIRAAHKELRAQVRVDLKNLSEEERAEARTAFKAAREEKRSQKEVLTDEQKQALKDRMAELGIKRHGKWGKRSKRNWRARLSNLSDEQKAEVKTMRAEMREQAEGLSREEKRELRKSFFERIKSAFGQ